MSESSPAGNRRLTGRRTPKGGLQVVCHRTSLDLGRNVALSALDLSETGARLVVDQFLPPGQDVALGLDPAACRRPFVCTATVVWCLSSADGTCCVGLRFHKRLPYADFFQMAVEPAAAPSQRLGASEGDPLQASPVPPARRATRRNSTRLVRLPVSTVENSSELEATLLDVSVTGAGLVWPGPLPVGQRVVLHLGQIAGRPTLDVAGRVAYAVALKIGACLLGVEFASRLPKDELEILLAYMGHAPVAAAQAGER